MDYRHSVSLDLDKCKGCTHCLRRCPTEAIRIRDGHAVINAIQCIDCGECIRVCPYKAKRAICDSLEDLDRSKYLIALPAPSLFGQFINVTDVDYVLQGLLDMGFNDVFEVSRCAEIITEYTRRYMKRKDIPRPAISSACPVVVRLITIRFPSLIDHIVPLMPPIELAGRMAKEEAMKLKQAKREKSMSIVQSIINTALGVVKTLAQWGIPAGIAPAAIMSAMGAAQTALIAAQPVTGKEEGGFVNTRREQDGKRFKARLSPDKRGFISSPTILVGENGGEYVIPAAGLDNPTLRPLLATIETARQAGRLKDLNFEAVYPLSSPIGRESGGYVRALPPESVPNVTASTSSRDSARLSEAIETLVRRLSKPIKADVSMTGRNGIIEKTEEYNRAKKRGQYNG